VRRTPAALLALALLGLTAAAAYASFTPQTGTYSGTSSADKRVLFTTDTHTAHGFTLDGIHIFDNAAITHHVSSSGRSTWSFHSLNSHFRAGGTWTSAEGVHGSICNLQMSSNDCRDGRGHQSYSAQLKTGK
jgi:hypothetical protein